MNFAKDGTPIPSQDTARAPFPVPELIVQEPDEALQEVVSLLYRAAGGQSDLWLEALSQLRDAFSSDSAQLTQVNLAQKKFNLMLMAVTDLDLISLDNYEAGAFDDPIGGVIAAFPGRPLSSDIHFDPDVLQFRVERGFVPFEHSRFLVVAHLKDGLWTIFGLTRSPLGEPFTPQDCARFGALSSDFARIGSTLSLARALKESPTAVLATLNALDVPLALVHGNGDFIAANPSAQSLLGSQNLPWTGEADWVAATIEAARYGLAHYTSRHGLVKLKRLSSDPINNLGAARSYSSIDVLVDLSDLRKSLEKSLDRVASTFGLTAAETDIIRLLGEGKSASEIASLRHSSKETVRAQLRAIRTKTGKSRQAELAALLR